MARPAAAARTLDEIAAWRAACPDLTLRSTFITGYPGETEAEFETLLDWLDEAQLDRVGAFQYEDVPGARSNALPDHVPAEVKQDRWDRFMARAQAISAAKLEAKVGRTVRAIVDEVEDGEDGPVATCRTTADAPAIDGHLYIDADGGLVPRRPRPRPDDRRRGRGGRRVRPLGPAGLGHWWPPPAPQGGRRTTAPRPRLPPPLTLP